MVNPIIITQVFDTCVNAAQFVRWVSGMDSNSDTVITWGDIVSGQCQYFYFDSDNVRTIETADFMFNTGVSGDTFLMSGEHVTATAIRNSATGSGSAPGLLASAPNSSVIGWQCGTFYDYVISVDGVEYAPQHSDSARLFMYTAYGGNYPSYHANTQSTSAYLGYIDNSDKIDFNTVYNVSRMYPDAPYIPVSGQQLSYSQIRPYILQWANDVNQKETDSNGETIYEPLTIDDIPTWYEVTTDTTEPTEETGDGCCCNCTVYVDADGNVTINNDGDTVTNFNVDADATLEANISAAAGAFGAGAIVIDADAEVNLQALAGAFGAGAISVEADGSIVVSVAAGGFAAGAFGAGAIVNPEINVSGEVSGSVSIGATDVNFSVSGGDVSLQQSGTVNNYYYYNATEPTEEPFTIDYDEIMSPSEFYDIMDYTNGWEAPYLETIPSDTFSALPAETLPLEIVGVAAPALDAVTQVISSSGLLPLLAPVSAISFYLHFLQR